MNNVEVFCLVEFFSVLVSAFMPFVVEPIVAGWPYFAECAMPRLRKKMEGDILDCFWLLPGENKKFFFEFFLLYKDMYIVELGDITCKIPAHAGFRAVSGVTCVATEQYFKPLMFHIGVKVYQEGEGLSSNDEALHIQSVKITLLNVPEMHIIAVSCR